MDRNRPYIVLHGIGLVGRARAREVGRLGLENLVGRTRAREAGRAGAGLKARTSTGATFYRDQLDRAPLYILTTWIYLLTL